MKKLLFLSACLVVTANSAHAGWFWYSSYDECLADKMKGISNDIGKHAVMRTCREKFPPPPRPPPSESECRRLIQEERAAKEAAEAANRRIKSREHACKAEASTQEGILGDIARRRCVLNAGLDFSPPVYVPDDCAKYRR